MIKKQNIFNSKDSIFEHDQEYEPFYTSLMSFCAYNVLKFLETCESR